jgi:hypothetical protein
VAIAWANFGERGDPVEYDNKEGYERIEAGETVDRTFEEKQKNPGDAEAAEGMGSISLHKGEHLMPTDHGIMAYRRHIRKSIKSLQEGIDPEQPQKNGDLIKTYGQDTVLRVPKRNIDDRKFIKSIGSSIMKLQFDSEKMPNKDRDNFIINELSNMEKNGVF